MQRSGLKQPIYLTKLKRKCKLIDQPLQRHDVPKDYTIHDMPFVQKSVDVQKRRGSEQLNTRLNDMVFSNVNRAESISNNITNRNGKASYRLFDRSTSGSFLQDITQNSSNITLLGYSKEPPETYNKEQLLCGDKKILDQPKLACLKARAISTINVNKQASQIELKPSQEAIIEKISNRDCEQSISKIDILKRKYELQIMGLEQKNKVLENRVHTLQEKLKENQDMQLRVSQIQKDLNEMFQQNQELYKINEELYNSQIKGQNTQIQTQTQFFPLFVQDSFCQTSIPQPKNIQPKTQLSILNDLTAQDWFNRAKMWKIQLQRQKMMSITRQTQFRLSLDNAQVKHRQEMSMVQHQLSVITMNYDRKCQQVKQKQGIINKYVLHKAP